LPISDRPSSAEAEELEGGERGAAADEQETREAVRTELQQLKEAARFATPERAVAVLEALFFAAEKPLDLAMLEEVTQFSRELLERKLIRILGKKDEPGRPLIYGTTKEFLELFNLRDLTQLPTLREFQELSEESRRIVEGEAETPVAAGLSELAADPVVEERIVQATAESESALAQLESAMERADESAKSTATVLAPPAPPEPPKAE